MLRYLRIAASVLCLLTCVMLVTLWMRSHWYADQFHVRYYGRQSILLASKMGRLIVVAHQNMHDVGWRSLHVGHPVDDELSFPTGSVRQYESVAGFGLIHQPKFKLIPSNPGGKTVKFYFGPWNSRPGTTIQVPTSLDGSGVIAPFWFFVLLSATFAAVPWIPWSRRFSLRTLLIAMTLIAVLLGLIFAFGR